MTRVKEKLLELSNRMTYFHMVDTQNPLRPGHPDDWLNEIHPTPSEYEQIAKKVYALMRESHWALPAKTHCLNHACIGKKYFSVFSIF